MSPIERGSQIQEVIRVTPGESFKISPNFDFTSDEAFRVPLRITGVGQGEIELKDHRKSIQRYIEDEDEIPLWDEISPFAEVVIGYSIGRSGAKLFHMPELVSLAIKVQCSSKELADRVKCSILCDGEMFEGVRWVVDEGNEEEAGFELWRDPKIQGRKTGLIWPAYPKVFERISFIIGLN